LNAGISTQRTGGKKSEESGDRTQVTRERRRRRTRQEQEQQTSKENEKRGKVESNGKRKEEMEF